MVVRLIFKQFWFRYTLIFCKQHSKYDSEKPVSYIRFKTYALIKCYCIMTNFIICFSIKKSCYRNKNIKEVIYKYI